ncbi:MAG: hypothetical protein NTY51_12485 [Deltaproteobacteria bacterium]|nr:hypothetical protein [Deltaproteobacteria bacterium]
MKSFYKLLLISVCTCSLFLFACQEKKESTAPANKPQATENVQKPDQSSQQQGFSDKDREQINKIQDLIK